LLHTPTAKVHGAAEFGDILSATHCKPIDGFTVANRLRARVVDAGKQ
jgi:hypothetical protein